MKNITFRLIMSCVLAVTVISCGNDDDNAQTTTNGITINGNFMATENAYLILDRTAPYDDGFWMAFTDGNLINDAGNNVLASTNTKLAAALLIDNNAPEVASQDLVNVNTGNYTLDKEDTAVVDNITNFTSTITQNGNTYGQIDQDTATNYLIENSGSGSLNITAIIKNFTTRDGTITCTFSITDDNGVIITGEYSGPFKMLNGDT